MKRTLFSIIVAAVMLLAGSAAVSQSGGAASEAAKKEYVLAEAALKKNLPLKALQHARQAQSLLGSNNARLESVRFRAYRDLHEAERANRSVCTFFSLKPAPALVAEQEDILNELLPISLQLKSASRFRGYERYTSRENEVFIGHPDGYYITVDTSPSHRKNSAELRVRNTAAALVSMTGLKRKEDIAGSYTVAAEGSLFAIVGNQSNGFELRIFDPRKGLIARKKATFPGLPYGPKTATHPNGGVVLHGVNSDRLYLARRDAKGKEIWAKNFPFVSKQERKVLTGADGTIVVVGRNDNEVRILSVATDGTQVFSRSIDLGLEPLSFDGAQVFDGALVFFARSREEGMAYLVSVTDASSGPTVTAVDLPFVGSGGADFAGSARLRDDTLVLLTSKQISVPGIIGGTRRFALLSLDPRSGAVLARRELPKWRNRLSLASAGAEGVLVYGIDGLGRKGRLGNDGMLDRPYAFQAFRFNALSDDAPQKACDFT